MLVALTRAVPPTITACELTHVARDPIDVALATMQHADYEDMLRALGARVERVAAAPELPDSVFIEDTAVVFDETAVIDAARRHPSTGRGGCGCGNGRTIPARPVHRRARYNGWR